MDRGVWQATVHGVTKRQIRQGLTHTPGTNTVSQLYFNKDMKLKKIKRHYCLRFTDETIKE